MPRPVSQYFSLPFSWHCICSPPRCLPELCRMPAAIRRRPGKRRRRRVGTPTRHSSGAGRPGRLRQYPTHPAQAFGAARRPVSNSDTNFCGPLPGDRPVGQPAPGRVKSQAVASRPAESRISPAAYPPNPLHYRSILGKPAALLQRSHPGILMRENFSQTRVHAVLSRLPQNLLWRGGVWGKPMAFRYAPTQVRPSTHALMRLART